MLIHPKAGFNVRDCYCSRCGRNHHDRIAMGANDFVDTCPKCGAMYYGGNDKNACVKCGEHYTANAAYCRAIWKRRYVPKTERVPAKGPCQICVDFILAVEEAAKAGGIGVRCKSCRSEHVIGGETQFAKKVREQLKIEAPAVAFAILTKCFNCASEEQQKSLGLIEEAKAEEQSAQSGALGDGVPIKHLGADQVSNEEEESAHMDLTNLRETLVRMRNAVRDEGEEGKVEDMRECEDAQTISFPQLCHAPFTDEQIKSIREYQRCEFVHALTCEEHSNVALTAAAAGLRCPMSGCRYSQRAVHEMIANGEWRATADRIREFLQYRESKSYANENEAEA